MFVGPEKRKMKLVAVTDTDSGFTVTGDTGSDNSEWEKKDTKSSSAHSEDSGKNSSQESSEESGETVETIASSKTVETSTSGESIQEIHQDPKQVDTYEIDSSQSEDTENIYSKFMDGSKISLPTLSTLSGFTESDKSVKGVGMSSTVEYSEGSNSIEILSDRSTDGNDKAEELDKKKRSERSDRKEEY